MLNFSVIILMWMVLIFGVLVSCNYFVGVAKEMNIVLEVMDQLIFATLPLLAASIGSWFLCVEIPSLDLLLCFNGIYFVYMLFLGIPRPTTPEPKKSGKTSPTTVPSAAQSTQVMLPPHLLVLMYAIPVVVTILMHIAVHHNVLMTTHTRITNFVLSVVISCLLMAFCAYKQLLPLVQARAGGGSQGNDLPKLLDGATFLLSTALIYCLESHPMLDELKSFSDLSDEAAGYCIMAATALVGLAFAVHRFCQQQSLLLAEQSEYLNADGAVGYSKMKLKYMSMFASLCIGGANALIVTVIGLPDHAVGVSIVGAMSLAEYYLHPDWSLSSRCILVAIAALYSSLAANSFIQMTLQGIAYQFDWYFDVSLTTLTYVVIALVPVAIVLPTLLGPSAAAGSEAEMGLLPGAQIASAGQGGSWGNTVFEWAFPLVCVVVSAMELLVREQVRRGCFLRGYCFHWQLLNLTAARSICDCACRTGGISGSTWRWCTRCTTS